MKFNTLQHGDKFVSSSSPGFLFMKVEYERGGKPITAIDLQTGASFTFSPDHEVVKIDL